MFTIFLLNLIIIVLASANGILVASQQASPGNSQQLIQHQMNCKQYFSVQSYFNLKCYNGYESENSGASRVLRCRRKASREATGSLKACTVVHVGCTAVNSAHDDFADRRVGWHAATRIEQAVYASLHRNHLHDGIVRAIRARTLSAHRPAPNTAQRPLCNIGQ